MSNEATLKSIWSFSDKDVIGDMEGRDSTQSMSHFKPPWCQPKSDLNDSNPAYESDDSQDSFHDAGEDYTAIPVQFRPKFHGNSRPKFCSNSRPNPGKTDSVQERKCNDKNSNHSLEHVNSYSSNKADKPKNSSQTQEKTLYGDDFLNSGSHGIPKQPTSQPGSNSKSDELIVKKKEQIGKKPVLFKFSEAYEQAQDKKKMSLDPRLQPKLLSAVDGKNNLIKKRVSFYNEIAEVSVETLRLSDDIESFKHNADGNGTLHKENGYPLDQDEKPKRTCKNRRRGNYRPKGVSNGRGRAIRWDDNICLLNSNKNINFQYISKEVKEGSSTITECWGNVQQRTTRRFHRDNIPCNSNHGNKRNSEAARKNKIPQKQAENGTINHKQNSESTRKNEIPQKQTENGTSNQLHTSTINTSYDNKRNSESSLKNKIHPKQTENETINRLHTSKSGDNRSKNPKTQIIRHEINVHVNKSSSPLVSETKESVSGTLKDQDDTILKNIVSGSVKNRIFAFEIKVNLEDQKLKSAAYITQNRRCFRSSPSPDVEEKTVSSSTMTKMVFSDLKVSSDDMKRIRNTLIQYGKEISDLTVGGYIGTMTLLSFYGKWIPIRENTVRLLEQLADNISNLNRRNNKIKNVVGFIDGGCKIVAVAPDLRVNIVAKIVATINSVFSKLYQSSPSLEHSGLKESEMMRFLQEDIEATSDVYMYGIQCDHQFQEVCKLIGEFQHFIDDGNVASFIEGPDADFIKEMLHFSPKNYVVYYRKLYKCFEKLREKQTSEISKAFCRAFEVSPTAIEVINQLHWRFHAKETDNESVKRAWEEACLLLASSDSTGAILKKIQDCIQILIKERNAMDKNLADLIKHKT